jgi:hypothetical protein
MHERSSDKAVIARRLDGTGERTKDEGKGPENSFSGDSSLALADVLSAEQELSVQVTHIDGVQVHNFDLSEARKHQDLMAGSNIRIGRNHVILQWRKSRTRQRQAGNWENLEKFAADTTGAYNKHARVRNCTPQSYLRKQFPGSTYGKVGRINMKM